MEKKEYIKPELEVMALEAESQMMTSSPSIQPGIGNGDATDGEVLSTGRRGRWGDLWSKD